MADNDLSACEENLPKPEICYKYNNKVGCADGISCNRLHLCNRFITSECRHGIKCRGCHDVSAEQPMAVLIKCGFHVIEEGPDQVLSKLRALLAKPTPNAVPSQNDHQQPEIERQPIICNFHNSKLGCRKGKSCTNLHICYHYIHNQCRFTVCHKSHDLTTDHAKQILNVFGIDVVTLGTESVREKLRNASSAGKSSVERSNHHLKQTTVNADNSIKQPQSPFNRTQKGLTITKVPDVCYHYNGKGCTRNDCPGLHLCLRYVIGDCKFGQSKCNRSHYLMSDQPKAVLVDCGFDIAKLSEQQILKMLNDHVTDKGQQQQRNSGKKVEQQDSETQDADPEICQFHLFGRCKYQNNDCYKFHSTSGLPYQWQWTADVDGTKPSWTNFCHKANEKIESHYCNAAEELIEIDDDTLEKVTINYDNKSFGGQKTFGIVRRLGTVSSVAATVRNRYTTVWVWYWLTEQGLWQAYSDAKPSDGASTDTTANKGIISSDEIEQKYLSNPISRLQFQCGGSTFLVDLQKMTQVNQNTQQTSKLRRRPELYRPREEKVASTTLSSPTTVTSFPSYWDQDAMKDESKDYVLVPVVNSGRTAAEYQRVFARFSETMPGITVKSIQRVQNRDRWESFESFKTRINRKRSTPAALKSLFHGTRSQYVEAICQQGFDWRMYGSSAYGKGSYFARDASYSNCYTDCKTMFLVQVIVGDYTVGNSTMVRPPPKDPTKPFQELYDSVVNEVNNPLIFVTFDMNQSYPEYLIEYC